MTNYEMLKNASKLELANMLCHLVSKTDDGCDNCPACGLCYVGHNDTTTIARELKSNPFMAYAIRHEH